MKKLQLLVVMIDFLRMALFHNILTIDVAFSITSVNSSYIRRQVIQIWFLQKSTRIISVVDRGRKV